MPRAPKTCPTPGCWETQPCPAHKRPAWQGSTRRSRLPKNWPTLRRKVLAAQPTCAHCHKLPATDVDHIVAGDNHDLANLQGLCSPCHTRKTVAERDRRRGAR